MWWNPMNYIYNWNYYNSILQYYQNLNFYNFNQMQMYAMQNCYQYNNSGNSNAQKFK